MSEETMDFSASAVLKRMRDSLQNPVNKIEGGFSMDNLQAVAEEMARMDAMEVQPIPDHVLLDTAEGGFNRLPADAAEAIRQVVEQANTL